MSMAEPLTVLKSELLQKIVPELVDLLASALARRKAGPQGRGGLVGCAAAGW